MIKMILPIILMSFMALGQGAYNYKCHDLAITGFTGTALRYTNKFPAGDYEGVDVVVLSNSQDSANFIVGYQRGYPAWGTTVWERPWTSFDTFNVATAASYKLQDSLTYCSIGDTDAVKGIDSAQLSGYTMMIRHLSLFRSPYARFVVKGLTGNSVEPYNLFFVAIQPKYTRVDVGTSNQPEQ